MPSGKLHSLRLSLKETEEGVIIKNMSLITSFQGGRIFVVGYTQEKEQEERRELETVVGLIDKATSWRHRFMMWPERLRPQRSCLLI